MRKKNQLYLTFFFLTFSLVLAAQSLSFRKLTPDEATDLGQNSFQPIFIYVYLETPNAVALPDSIFQDSSFARTISKQFIPIKKPIDLRAEADRVWATNHKITKLPAFLFINGASNEVLAEWQGLPEQVADLRSVASQANERFLKNFLQDLQTALATPSPSPVAGYVPTLEGNIKKYELVKNQPQAVAQNCVQTLKNLFQTSFPTAQVQLRSVANGGTVQWNNLPAATSPVLLRLQPSQQTDRFNVQLEWGER